MKKLQTITLAIALLTLLFSVAACGNQQGHMDGNGMMHGNGAMGMMNWNWLLIVIVLGIGLLIGVLVARRKW